jgi:hypothetical protein
MDSSVLSIHCQHVLVYTGMLRLISKKTGNKQLLLWKVEKVQYLKSKKISLHESLLAYVLSPDRKRCRILFKRAGGELQVASGLRLVPRMLIHHSN